MNYPDLWAAAVARLQYWIKDCDCNGTGTYVNKGGEIKDCYMCNELRDCLRAAYGLPDNPGEK